MESWSCLLSFQKCSRNVASSLDPVNCLKQTFLAPRFCVKIKWIPGDHIWCPIFSDWSRTDPTTNADKGTWAGRCTKQLLQSGWIHAVPFVKTFWLTSCIHSLCSSFAIVVLTLGRLCCLIIHILLPKSCLFESWYWVPPKSEDSVFLGHKTTLIIAG